MKVAIDRIKVAERIRKEVVKIEELADSMKGSKPPKRKNACYPGRVTLCPIGHRVDQGRERLSAKK
ncbi:hypothetical protein FACS1894217_13630 [Clostridia bacterium]|nr:hypothetical protein FACS1894217_13630 [Clostridia bacterium]